jgi:hypothetical protein
MLGLYVGFRGISDMERFSARSESAANQPRPEADIGFAGLRVVSARGYVRSPDKCQTPISTKYPNRAVA